MGACRSRAKASDAAIRKPRKRVKPMSDKRRDELPERREVWKRVFDRDGGRCRVAPFLPDNPCHGELHPHHLLKASQGGEYTDDNLLTCCDHHNTWIEDNPREAEALGLVRRPTPAEERA